MRTLPLDYPVRNLARRPLRTALTAGSCALVAALLAATASFVRGLGTSAASQGRDDVGLLLSRASEEDIVRSSVGAGLAEEVAAAVSGVARAGGVPAVSPEIHVGTRVWIGDDDAPRDGFVRAVDARAFLVHDVVTITDGRPPGPGEVLVGRLVARQLGVDEGRLAIGRELRFENGTFRVSGHFAAPGTTIESELWAPLQDVVSLTRRDDVSTVFVRFEEPSGLSALELFARRRLDLELDAVRSTDYYAALAAWFGPIQALAWVLAGMMAAAATFGAANTLNAAVQDRVRELATLRAVGYGTPSLVLALVQEGAVVASTGGLLGVALARVLVEGAAVGIAMGAFQLDVGPAEVLTGAGAVFALGVLSALPAAVRVARLPVALALKET